MVRSLTTTKNPLTSKVAKDIALFIREKYIEKKYAFSKQGLLLDLQVRFFKNRYVGKLDIKHYNLSDNSHHIVFNKFNRFIDIYCTSHEPMRLGQVSVTYREIY